MDPKIQQFLIFNGIVVLIVVVYILYRPNGHAFKLRMRDGRNSKSIDTISQDLSKTHASHSFKKSQSQAYQAAHNTTSMEKELNVIFQFNGHSFDAYEVLGVPAGCSMQTVEEAYTALIKSSDQESHEFYIFAYKAITKR